MLEHGETSPWPSFRYYAEALWMVVKGRKGRHLFITTLLVSVSVVLLWSYSVENLSPSNISAHRGGNDSWHADEDLHAKTTAATAEAPSPPPSTIESPNEASQTSKIEDAAETPTLEPLPFTAKNGPTFRLLIPAADSDSNFCRGILSTILLDYPPPTILGYSKDQTSTVVGRIYDHLEDRHIRDDDLILIADGYRAWFQLPSSVLVRQYQRVIAEANHRLQKNYGTAPPKRPGESLGQRFRQTVLFAADTHCWHYAADGVACDAVPDSPMWESAIAANASARNVFNPKFLNSGIVMGPARDLRAVFAAASKKSTGRGGVHDLQNALQQIYSEQEQARQLVWRANLGTTNRIREWLYERICEQLRFRRFGFQGVSEGARRPVNFTVQPGRNYEYAIGLDYDSVLFQSISAPHSFNGDIEFLAADDVLAFSNASAHDLPPALAALGSPFHLLDRDRASADIPDNATTPLTVTPGLDDLPDDLPWSVLPLARNLRTGSAPASLHFPPRLSSSGDVSARSPGASYSSPKTNTGPRSKSLPSNANKSSPHHRLSPLYQTPKPPASNSKPKRSPLSPGAESLDGIDPGTDTTTPPSLAHLDPRDSIYRHLWFAPYARALLRRHMRQTTYSSLLSNEITAAEDDEALAESHPGIAAGAWERARQRELAADRRGGKGGVWTQQGEWLGWDEVCAGVEEDVFGSDGWGDWGKEREGKGLFEDERKQAAAKAVEDEKEKAAAAAAAAAALQDEGQQGGDRRR